MERWGEQESWRKSKKVENKNGPGQLCQIDMARGVRGKKSSFGSCVAEVSQQEASHTSQLALAQVKVGRNPSLALRTVCL